ncbi:hypothetical protein [Streptomyces fumanus]|uniref:Regulatory protein n=1 Tax=Streptomyces fumanus TaxID=67302 RepID=A0A919AGI0_9ACTN|nr:hypothetical protein [Streptomyces fumanus]GHF01559.1 hypothetical protein GCM10018772_28030 [Streptomyces fumanus]
MTETANPATEIASQYATQVSDDLDRNTKEQERLTAEIAALQEQLAALQRDHSVLVNIRQALAGTAELVGAALPAPRTETEAPETGATATEAPAGEAPADKAPEAGSAGGTRGKKSRAKKSAPAQRRTAKKAPAGKAPAGKAPAKSPAKGGKKAGAPTLGELILGVLTEQTEPRSAAEVATALNEAHPERQVKTTVARNTLESLVAKNQVQRSKQGTSVYYTAPAAPASAGTSEPEAGADQGE